MLQIEFYKIIGKEKRITTDAMLPLYFLRMNHGIQSYLGLERELGLEFLVLLARLDILVLSDSLIGPIWNMGLLYTSFVLHKVKETFGGSIWKLIPLTHVRGFLAYVTRPHEWSIR